MSVPRIVIEFGDNSYDGPCLGESITKNDDISRDMRSPQVMDEQERFKEQLKTEHMPQHILMAFFEKIHNELLKRKRQRVDITTR